MVVLYAVFPCRNICKKYTIKNRVGLSCINNCLSNLCILANFYSSIVYVSGYLVGGVFLAEEYLKSKSIDIRSVKLPSVGLMIMAGILCINSWLYCLNSKTYSIGLHPLLEFRHMLFAFIAIHVAILWRKVNWFGFDFIFKPFVILSPISYVIYISHYYLIAHASYFSFINQPVIEFMLYFIVLIVFSSLIEIKFYPSVKRFFRL